MQQAISDVNTTRTSDHNNTNTIPPKKRRELKPTERAMAHDMSVAEMSSEMIDPHLDVEYSTTA